MLAFKGLTNRPLVYLYNCTFLYYISADYHDHHDDKYHAS